MTLPELGEQFFGRFRVLCGCTAVILVLERSSWRGVTRRTHRRRVT